VEPLRKAVNDARAIASALSGIGFHVDLRVESDESEFLEAVSALASRVKKDDEVVFFFAGHGIEVDGQNYLLPSDVPTLGPGSELIIRRRSIPVADIIDLLNKQGARVSILILDACRNNPFPRQGTRSLGGSRGLAQVQPPVGTAIIYSAGTGEAALDRLSDNDPDPNSVFTRTLLPRLTEPGRELSGIMREVRSEVRRLARTVDHEQFLGFYDQLDGEYFFVPGRPIVPDADVPSVGSDPCNEARADWDRLGSNPGAVVLEAFKTSHAACPLLAAAATERLAALKNPAPRLPNRSDTILQPPPVNETVPEQPPPPLPRTGRELFRKMQVELNRLGCNAGQPDGVWGARSSRALQTYLEATGRSGDQLSYHLVLLDELKSRSDQVCPPECKPNENLSDGVCVPQQRPVVAPAAKPVQPRRSGECFTAFGVTRCN